MELSKYKLELEKVSWVSPMEGVKHKIGTIMGKNIRLVEYSSKMPVHWCEKGHFGVVLEGIMEIEYSGTKEKYKKGDIIAIPDGRDHRHRGKVVGESCTCIFFSDEKLE